MKLHFVLSILISLIGTNFLSAQDNFFLRLSDDSCEVVLTTYMGAYPPSLSSMPWYVASSYAVIDSVSRSSKLTSIEDSIRNLSDNLLRLGYYHYLETIRYNPILYQHYWWSSVYGDDYTYTTRPRATLAAMLEEYYRRFGEPDSNQEKIFDADGGIYEIYVESVNMRQDEGLYGLIIRDVIKHNTYTYCATGIIETVHFGTITNFPEVVLDGIHYQTIQMSWEMVKHPAAPDFVFDPAKYLVQGRRYLVFADAYKVSKYGTTCDWAMLPGKIFLIGDDGQIADPTRFFGSAPVISIVEARSIIQSWITSLYN